MHVRNMHNANLQAIIMHRQGTKSAAGLCMNSQCQAARLSANLARLPAMSLKALFRSDGLISICLWAYLAVVDLHIPSPYLVAGWQQCNNQTFT